MLRSVYDFDLILADGRKVRCEWVFCDDTDVSRIRPLPWHHLYASHVMDGFEQGTNEFGERVVSRSKPHKSRKADDNDLSVTIGDQKDWNSRLTIEIDNCGEGCEVWSPDGDTVVSHDGESVVIPEDCGCELWSPDGDTVVSHDGESVVIPEACTDCDCEVWTPGDGDSVSPSPEEIVLVISSACC